MAHPESFTADGTNPAFNDTAISAGYKYLSLPPLQQLPLLPQHPSAFRRHPPSISTGFQPSRSYLVLMVFGRAAYNYDLTHLGFPYSVAASQATEPFWSQFDHIQQVARSTHQSTTYGYDNYNYVYNPFNMQDFVPVFIGSNTANGRILKAEDVAKRPRYHGDALTKPFGRVTLYINDSLVQDARCQDLIRFSKTIGARFLKEGKAEAEADIAQRLGFSVEITRFGKDRAITLANPQDQVWTSPPDWAFAEILSWIDLVRNLPRTQDLPAVRVAKEGAWTLHELIDVYAAAVALDLRPRAVLTPFRGAIIRRLAYVPATAQDFQYLHERLPVGDAVLRKMVETFFVHGERGHYWQKDLRGEVGKVQEYVNGCGHADFKALVIEMQERRQAVRMEEANEGLTAKEKGKGKKGKARAGSKEETTKKGSLDGSDNETKTASPTSSIAETSTKATPKT